MFVVEHRRERALGRHVAVKGVRADARHRARAVRYAIREARVRAGVTHPNLLPLYELAGGDDDPLLIGPWHGAGTLRARPALSLDEALAVARGVGAALDALHAAGWRHGDVSPGNVLVGGFAPVLADLGSARRLGARGLERGSFVGTPHVTAPEVWSGEAVDGRADVYGLGALLYRVLSGHWPFEARDAASFAALHRSADVPHAGLGPAVEHVLRRALAKDRRARFATGGELAAALGEGVAADGPTAAPSRAGSAASRLERFASGLDERERAALHLILRRSAAAEARARDETEQILTQLLAPGAALRALEETGAAHALAAGAETPADVAQRCDAPEETVRLLLEVLAALGLLGREGDRYRLPPGPASVYAASGAAPAREAAWLWSQLPAWAATGEPVAAADGAVYEASVRGLSAVSAAAADELAHELLRRGVVARGGNVLDVGAGSGVWGRALAGAAGARLTALDRPHVVERAGLDGDVASLPGDWHEVELPPAAYDVALLANVCHLEPPAGVERLLGRVRPAVRPDGAVVVVDTMPSPGDDDPGPLLQSLHLALRTPGGRVHGRPSYEAWLARTRFAPPQAIPLRASDGRLTALVARAA